MPLSLFPLQSGCVQVHIFLITCLNNPHTPGLPLYMYDLKKQNEVAEGTIPLQTVAGGGGMRDLNAPSCLNKTWVRDRDPAQQGDELYPSPLHREICVCV